MILKTSAVGAPHDVAIEATRGRQGSELLVLFEPWDGSRALLVAFLDVDRDLLTLASRAPQIIDKDVAKAHNQAI